MSVHVASIAYRDSFSENLEFVRHQNCDYSQNKFLTNISELMV